MLIIVFRIRKTAKSVWCGPNMKRVKFVCKLIRGKFRLFRGEKGKNNGKKGG